MESKLKINDIIELFTAIHFPEHDCLLGRFVA
jgi:hypothetical protein